MNGIRKADESENRLDRQQPIEDVFHIRRREDFDLFCSPIRASILEYLIAFGPMSARDIAARIGRSAALTHHHVGILLRGGLLREVSREKRGKHVERIFAVSTEVWKYDFETDPKAIAEGILRIARTWGRHSERLLWRVLSRSNGLSPHMQKFTTIRAETGRLSEKSAEAVREHLMAIRRIFERDRKRGEGEVYQIFWSYFPLENAEQSPASDMKASPKSKVRKKQKKLAVTNQKKRTTRNIKSKS